MRCRACDTGIAEAPVHELEESMFGLGERFRYRECKACGSLSIEQVPADLARHYPSGYYSFADGGGARGFTAWVKRHRDAAAVGRFDPIGALALPRYPHEALSALRPLALANDARILDVGCGRGLTLRALRAVGFTRLAGADPFLDADFDVDGIPIRRAAVGEVEGSFDVITFHHSLEHVPHPAADLAAAATRLDSGGTIVVRVPLAGSRAWEIYGVHWIQLDPPRHLFLPTRAGIDRLAGRAGLRVERVLYDSSEYQFWASEQVKAGIAVLSKKSWRVDPAGSTIVTTARLRKWRALARRWNREEAGDQAAFYLRKA